MELTRAAGSFRDPCSGVFIHGGRILRGLRGIAARGYRALEQSGLLAAWQSRGELVKSREMRQEEAPPLFAEFDIVLEHEQIECVTYPYEWSFPALKAAALLHLDMQLRALDAGIALRDASAYNVQFAGARPVFIDMGSFKAYEPGELWLGYEQFTRQFLNPLLLSAVTGVSFQPWLRGSPEGLSAEDLTRLLPWRNKLSLRIFMHVVLPARMQRGATRRHVEQASHRIRSHSLSPRRYRAMLLQLREWVAQLASRSRDAGWIGYADNTSYSSGAHLQKQAFIAEFVRAAAPGCLLDLGCNTGEYAAHALANGARSVIGLESDIGALDSAFRRAQDGRLAFLPLYQDLADASPGLGWRLAERPPLRSRLRADAVLALAVVHHLVIGRNLPLDEVVAEIVSLAQHGVIEFVEKSDPMVQRLLALREDVFPGYTLDAFRDALARVARIECEQLLDGGSRRLFRFERKRGVE